MAQYKVKVNISNRSNPVLLWLRFIMVQQSYKDASKETASYAKQGSQICPWPWPTV